MSCLEVSKESLFGSGGRWLPYTGIVVVAIRADPTEVVIVARLSPYIYRCVVCRGVGYSLNTRHKRGRLIVMQRLTKEDVGERGAEKLFVRGSVSDSAPCLGCPVEHEIRS